MTSGWPAPLTRPLRVKNGPTLRTLHDFQVFILSEPKALQGRKIWQCACELLLAAAARECAIGLVTEKAELALFLEGRAACIEGAQPARHQRRTA